MPGALKSSELYSCFSLFVSSLKLPRHSLGSALAQLTGIATGMPENTVKP